MIIIKKKYLAFFIIILIISLVLAGCNAGAEELQIHKEQQVQEIISTQKAETAVFEMAVLALLTERAPTITSTFPPSSTPTETPEPTLTPTTVRDPWVFQDICIKEPGRCVPYTINNMFTDSWISIKLTHQETGEIREFLIDPLTIETIILVPGEYEGIFGAWCEGKILTLIRVAELGAEIGSIGCRQYSDKLVYLKR